MDNDKPRAPVELRTAALSEVDYPARLIELVAVPWDEWAPVEVPAGSGKLIEESFAPGAFGAIEKRLGRARFLVNLDHDPDRWVGRVVGLDPKDARGMLAELQIRRTPEGDQVLVDAADGMYAASVGFASLPTGQQWTANRTRRRITTAYLDHIALTPQPAYASAGVVSVRSAPRSSTPNLDRVLAERAAAGYPAGGNVTPAK